MEARVPVTDDATVRATAKADAMLPAIVDILRSRGPEGFVLSTIAEDLGTSSRMLIYHFGSRDELLGRVMKLVRLGTIDALKSPPPSTLLEAVDRWWDYYMVYLSDMQLFFHLASRRFESPDQFEDFASTAVMSWSDYFGGALHAQGASDDEAAVLGRLTIATLRGLTVDYLISGDKEAVERSLERFRRFLR
jgi:AcrR family transcriptional regulator